MAVAARRFDEVPSGDWERVSPQRRRTLAFLALHGWARTVDVAPVVGVRRLTAQRDLTWLHDAGLVSRYRSDEDRTHAWWYEITPAGVRVVEAAMYAAGRRPPPRLGKRSPGVGHFLLFLPLAAYAAARPGECELFQWRTTMETSMWLRQYGLAHLRADASGVWLQDARALRFLVHVDPGPGALPSAKERHSRGLDNLIAPYRHGSVNLPVGAVLVVLTTPEREEVLLADLVRNPLRVPIVASNQSLLRTRWPADAVWQVPGDADGRRRLIDLTAGCTRATDTP